MSSLPPPSPAVPPATDVDLDRVAQDLADVEVALERLDDGTYWTCEVTGQTLPDELLRADPVARRISATPSEQPTPTP